MKVSELEGTRLDFWVARADGYGESFIDGLDGCCYLNEQRYADSCMFMPSTNWQQGGELIEKYEIDIAFGMGTPKYEGMVTALKHDVPNPDFYNHGMWFGKTPLIAAMRCIVASVYGDEIKECEK